MIYLLNHSHDLKSTTSYTPETTSYKEMWLFRLFPFLVFLFLFFFFSFLPLGSVEFVIGRRSWERSNHFRCFHSSSALPPINKLPRVRSVEHAGSTRATGGSNSRLSSLEEITGVSHSLLRRFKTNRRVQEHGQAAAACGKRRKSS